VLAIDARVGIARFLVEALLVRELQSQSPSPGADSDWRKHMDKNFDKNKQPQQAPSTGTKEPQKYGSQDDKNKVQSPGTDKNKVQSPGSVQR
jgi:hypothetical protein